MFTWCWQGFSHCHQTPLPVESVPLCSRPCRWSSQTGTQPDTGGPTGFWSLKIKTKCKFSELQITVYYFNVNLPFTVQTLKFCTHRNFFLNSCRHQWLPLHSQTSTVVRVESVDLASPQFDQLIKTSITVQGMQFYENFFFLILSLIPIILLQLKCLTQSIRSGAGMLMQPVQSGQEIFANIIRVRLHLTQSLGSQLFPFLFSIFQVPVIKMFQYEILI